MMKMKKKLYVILAVLLLQTTHVQAAAAGADIEYLSADPEIQQMVAVHKAFMHGCDDLHQATFARLKNYTTHTMLHVKPAGFRTFAENFADSMAAVMGRFNGALGAALVLGDRRDLIRTAFEGWIRRLNGLIDPFRPRVDALDAILGALPENLAGAAEPTVGLAISAHEAVLVSYFNAADQARTLNFLNQTHQLAYDVGVVEALNGPYLMVGGVRFVGGPPIFAFISNRDRVIYSGNNIPFESRVKAVLENYGRGGAGTPAGYAAEAHVLERVAVDTNVPMPLHFDHIIEGDAPAFAAARPNRIVTAAEIIAAGRGRVPAARGPVLVAPPALADVEDRAAAVAPPVDYQDVDPRIKEVYFGFSDALRLLDVATFGALEQFGAAVARLRSQAAYGPLRDSLDYELNTTISRKLLETLQAARDVLSVAARTRILTAFREIVGFYRAIMEPFYMGPEVRAIEEGYIRHLPADPIPAPAGAGYLMSDRQAVSEDGTHREIWMPFAAEAGRDGALLEALRAADLLRVHASQARAEHAPLLAPLGKGINYPLLAFIVGSDRATHAGAPKVIRPEILALYRAYGRGQDVRPLRDAIIGGGVPAVAAIVPPSTFRFAEHGGCPAPLEPEVPFIDIMRRVPVLNDLLAAALAPGAADVGPVAHGAGAAAAAVVPAAAAAVVPIRPMRIVFEPAHQVRLDAIDPALAAMRAGGRAWAGPAEGIMVYGLLAERPIAPGGPVWIRHVADMVDHQFVARGIVVPPVGDIRDLQAPLSAWIRSMPTLREIEGGLHTEGAVAGLVYAIDQALNYRNILTNVVEPSAENRELVLALLKLRALQEKYPEFKGEIDIVLAQAFMHVQEQNNHCPAGARGRAFEIYRGILSFCKDHPGIPL